MPHKHMVIRATTEDAYLSHFQKVAGGLLLEVNTDAMEPTLKAGDKVVFDHMAKRIDRDGIYVFRTFEGYILRRVTIEPKTGKIIASTDNPDHSDPVDVFPLTAENELVGRLLWVGRPL